ncbi:hypothetical protein BMF94_5680 [Rhodotorula taiwanensis]|uniref:START domain-containing protein n=1 Tax=Rhodotorula taiwanensis TaxID=741276 RepID=A0A2S5B3K3_9BASI|nr:hypothetical protein BMF94_5680 [Rhodotorula taiwanensis]
MTRTAIHEPELPAVEGYPRNSPWSAEIDRVREHILAELATQDGWTDLGEKQGVKLAKKYREHDSNPVPIVRGETLVENVEPYAFLAGVCQPPGMRKLWDPRTEEGMMLQRYSRNEVLFYAITKGKRFIASPRDLAGIQKDYVEADGTCMIIQTSVNTDDIPEQPHMQRATLDMSGWVFKPEGPHTRCYYIFQIALGGSIPSKLVSMVAAETPLCTGRARDLYYERGHAPYVRHDVKHEPSIIFQSESFDPDLAKREYRCTVTTGSQIGETFEIAYDLDRMYRQERGVDVTVAGDSDAVQVQDDGEGTLRIKTVTAGRTLSVMLRPRTLHLLKPLPSDDRFRRIRKAFSESLEVPGTFLHPHFANSIGHPLPDNFDRAKAAAPVFASPLEAGPHTPARRLSSPLLILASFPLAVRPRINSASLAWAIFRTLKSAHTSSSIFQRPRRLSYASIAQRLSMP